MGKQRPCDLLHNRLNSHMYGQTEAGILTNLPLWSRRPNHRARSTKIAPFTKPQEKMCGLSALPRRPKLYGCKQELEKTTSIISRAAFDRAAMLCGLASLTTEQDWGGCQLQLAIHGTVQSVVLEVRVSPCLSLTWLVSLCFSVSVCLCLP